MNRSIALVSSLLAALSSGCEDAPGDLEIPLEVVATLPDGQVGEPYRASIVGRGGSEAGYRFSVLGALPDGLRLGAAGASEAELVGTPERSGTFEFTVALTDGDGAEASADLVLRVSPPPALSIVTESLPDGSLQTLYETQLEAERGRPPYTWTLIAGALPTGVALLEEGTLRGTPSTAGTFEISVRVTDASAASAEAQYSLTILDESPPLALVTAELPDGMEAVPYAAQLSAEGGAPPYTWTISGDGPTGLSLEGEGNPVMFTGTPTTPGTYSFQVLVEDAEQTTARRVFVVRIARLPAPPRIVTDRLPDGEVTRPYSAPLSATDGAGPIYTWTISRGSLPPGLQLDGAEGLQTTLTGTPTAAGLFTFTVRVSDAAGRTDEAEYSVDVRPEVLPLQIVTSSVGAYVLPSAGVGEAYDQPIAARGGVGAYAWTVSAGRLPAGLTVEAAGTPSTRLMGVAGAQGTFDFTITVTDADGTTDRQAFRVVVGPPISPLRVVTSTLTPALVCHGYRAEIAASAGSNFGYQWSVSAGVLPEGLSLEPQGTPATQLRGVAVAGSAGAYPVTISVTDSDGGTAQWDVTVTVTDDGTGDRFVVMVGDAITDRRDEVLVSDVCRPTPTAAVRVSPVGTIGGAGINLSDFALSPDGSKVAFIGDFRRSSLEEVWITDLTQPPPYVPVVVSPAVGQSTSFDAFDLKWSPTGEHLVFLGDFTVNGVNELYAVDTRGPIVANSAIPIAPTPPSSADVDSQDYAFSPGGRYVAYTHDTSGSARYDLWVYDLTSGAPRAARKVNPPLPDASSDVNFPVAWVDDNRLLYHCDCAVATRDELFLADVSASTITPRVISDPGNAGDVRWSSNEPRFGATRDGRWAWYYGDLPSTAHGQTLYRVDLSDPTARGVAVHALPPIGQDVVLARPASGGRIVVEGDLQTASQRELFVFDLNRPVPQSVLSAKVSGVIQPAGNVFSFAVSPDGRHTAFIADAVTPGQLDAFLVDLDAPAAGAVQLTPSSTNPNLGVTEIFWAPASNWVALYGDLVTNGLREVFATNVAAGAPFNFVQLGPALAGGQGVNSPVVWRADGGGIIMEADLQAPGQDEAWWVSVDAPTTAVPLTNAPPNGNVHAIEGQGR